MQTRVNQIHLPNQEWDAFEIHTFDVQPIKLELNSFARDILKPKDQRVENLGSD